MNKQKMQKSICLKSRKLGMDGLRFGTRALLVLFGVLCAVWMFSFSAQAVGDHLPTQAPAHDRALTVTFTLGNKEVDLAAATKASIRLYRIGEYAGGTWKKTDRFAALPVTLAMASDKETDSLINTLEGYILRDGITPDIARTWLKDGTLQLTGAADGLKPGLYLAVADPIGETGKRMVWRSTLVAIPGISTEEPRTWLYTSAVVFKGEPEQPTEHEIEVHKVWQDKEGNPLSAKDHPAEITLQLLKDQTVQEEVKLSDANHWQHRFTKLSSGHRWTVTEKTVSEGFTVRVSEQRDSQRLVIRVVNSRLPDSSEVPTPNVPGAHPKSPEKPTPHAPSKLTQTGISSLPLLVFTFAGVTCLLMALALRKKQGK